MEFKNSKAQDIHIKPMLNDAFIVKVGCVELVYTNKSKMCVDLYKYLSDPVKVEQKYNDARLPRTYGTGGGMSEGAKMAHSVSDSVREQNKCATVKPFTTKRDPLYKDTR